MSTMHARQREAAPSILFAWEMGGSLGHLTKGAMLAEPLLDAGCEVAFALKDLGGADALLPAAYTLFQAPEAPRLITWPEPADHAEWLLHAGWGSASGLSARVRAWMGLLQANCTSLLVADLAPTAVLAARVLDVPVLLFGNGFAVPPSPWPLVRHWEPAPKTRLQQVRRHVLQAANNVLAAHGRPSMPDLESLYAPAIKAVCTWPELDQLPRPPMHAPDVQVGPLYLDHVGQAPEWPPGPGPSGPRVFVELRPQLAGLDAVMTALASLDASVLVRCEGLDPIRRRAWAGPQLGFVDQPVRMSDVAAQADLVVCSGSDMAQGMASLGVPVLGIPMNAEQRLAFERLVDLRVGRMWVNGQDAATELARHLQALLHAPQARQAARALAARHVDHVPAQAAVRLAEHVMAHLGWREHLNLPMSADGAATGGSVMGRPAHMASA
jgi:hypothetical protein